MADRVYTSLDDQLQQALVTASDEGLVAEGASRSERLRALALYADRHLREAREHEERRDAYRELALDEERLASIRASVLAAAEDGIL